jgi:pteridine reductase
MIKSLRGKTALITGGLKRIGRAVSLALAEEGVNVVAHYASSSDGEAELSAELKKKNARFWTIKADFTRPEEYGTLIKRAAAAAGGLDFLINNASNFSSDTIENMDLERLRNHMEVNAWAPFVLMREFSRQTGTGSIVNLLDSKVEGFDWEHVSYIVSKRTLGLLTAMSALKFAPGITVNAVAPGLILPPAGKDESYLQGLIGKVPLKRHGSPEDIAAAVVFLLKSDFITGQTIFVDGGRHASG